MNSVWKTAVVGAVAAAFVASVAIASGQQQGSGDPQKATIGQGRQGGPGQGRGFGRGRGGPLGGVFEDLTDQQREQVRAILESERQGQEGPPAEVKLRQALEQELLADSPNQQKIEDLRQQLVTAQSEALTRHIAVQQKINQTLTAEQRAKARERLAQRGAGRGEGRRGASGFRSFGR
jgi:Spy/CpxP family protein refolding chaperone